MQAITRIVLAVYFIGAVAVETLAPAHAQYYYPPPPGSGYGYQTYNGCPPGYTIQGWKLRALPRSNRWRMADLQRLPHPAIRFKEEIAHPIEVPWVRVTAIIGRTNRTLSGCRACRSDGRKKIGPNSVRAGASTEGYQSSQRLNRSRGPRRHFDSLAVISGGL